MNKTVIIVKREKSKGLAFLLVLLFGPFGLFYSTISGALIMIFLAPLAIVLIPLTSLIYSGMLWWDTWLKHGIMYYLLAGLLHYITCFIWTIKAIDKYNDELLKKSIEK